MFALILKAKKINLIKLLLILKYYTLPLKWLKLGHPQETLGQPCMQLGWRIQHSSS